MSSIITTADPPSEVRKQLPCLGCGEPMWTDRCHRICRRCQRRNSGSRMTHVYHTVLPRGAWPTETQAIRASDW